MKRLLSIVLSCTLCASVLLNMSIEAKAAEVEVTQNIYDTSAIPDLYNTGCKGELTPWREALGFEESATSCYITSSIQDNYGEPYYKYGELVADVVLFENIDFSDVAVTLNKPGLKSMAFENCKFASDSPYNISVGNNWAGDYAIYFENCTFSNSTSSSVGNGADKTYVYNQCLFKDSTKGAVANNSVFMNSYFININGNSIESLTGGNTSCAISNCRFDKIVYNENWTTTSCINLSTVETDNIYVSNVYLNGGQYPFKFNGVKPADTVEMFVFENIFIGDNYIGTSKFRREIENNDAETINIIENGIKDMDSLLVSSVINENNETMLVATNYTDDERTLLMITNNGSYKTTINACPDFETGRTYTSKSAFPFDLEITLPEDADYLVCYDITDETNPKQLRFVNNTEAAVYVNIEESLASAVAVDYDGSSIPTGPNPPSNTTGGNISFTANIDSWFEVSIPNSYNLTDLSNNLEFTAEGDIAGNKHLSITTDETLILTNDNNDELPALISMNKTKFNYLELKNIAQSAIVIEIEKMPAGRFAGELPIYISIIDAGNVISGDVNGNISYCIENNTITFSGTGNMPNYSDTYEMYKDEITTAIIEDGITSIGLKNFKDFTNLKTIYIGNDVTGIAGYSFQNCSDLESVYMPVNVVEVSVGCFVSNDENTTIYYEGTEEQFNQIVGVEHLANLTVLYEQTW